MMDRIRGTVDKPNFSVAKPLLFLIEGPLVLSVSLFPWRIVSMSLLIHSLNSNGFLVLLFINPVVDFGPVCSRIQHLLNVLAVDSLNSEDIVFPVRADDFWPLVASFIAFSQWLFQLRSVLLLFDVVEPGSQSLQILSLDHFSHMLP